MMPLQQRPEGGKRGGGDLETRERGGGGKAFLVTEDACGYYSSFSFSFVLMSFNFFLLAFVCFAFSMQGIDDDVRHPCNKAKGILVHAADDVHSITPSLL